MRPLNKLASSLALAGALTSCAGSNRPAPPVNPLEGLQQSAKKVDFAIAETKRLIQRSRGATYLADMEMRLAELYSERARYAWLTIFEKAKARGETSRAVEAPEARLLKNLAIGVYDRLLHESPDYPRADEALFLEAHEYRELGEFDSMRKAYERLIEEYPKSSHRIETFLILGDTEFDKGDLARAEMYYNKVLEEPESHIHSLARYKLGWVKVNREDCKGAVKLFEKILRDRTLVAGKRQIIATQKSLNVARESLVDIAYCYPEVYGDRPAAPYFRSLAQTSSDFMAAMRRVANRFAIKQMYSPAAAALREVLSAAVSDEDALESARKLYDNVQRGKSYDRAAEDVERIGRVLDAHYHDFRLADPVRKKLTDEFEVYARDIATKAHAHAKDVKTQALFANAAAAYAQYLAYFPNSKAKFDIEQNRAEALFAAELPYKTAQAYEEVAKTATNAESRKQARLSAISAYQRALEKGSLSRVERTTAWAGIRNLGRQVIADTPAGANPAAEAKLATIKLAIARSYYDSGDYSHAAELFYALARQYPQSQEGQAGAQLALDALRLQEDFEGLVTLGKRLLADKRLGDEKMRQDIATIVAKTEQRQIADLTISSGDSRDEKLLSFAERHKGSGLGEQALYNAMLLARDSGEIERFYQLGEEFTASYPKSERRVAVMAALAQAATDRADYSQAAQFLETIYESNPNAEDAVDRLFAAAQIRAALGDSKVVADTKKLNASRKAQSKIDELLMDIARSGNVGPLQDMLADTTLGGPVADFLRGYFAYQKNDSGEAMRHLDKVAREKSDQEAVAEAIARARFLVGEIAFDALIAPPTANELVKQITDKAELVAAADKAFALAIQSRRGAWAVGALGRVSDAYARYATFLHELKLPDDISAEEKSQLKTALEAKADEASKRSADLKSTCAKRAKESVVFSDAVRSCLTNQPFPDRVAIFPNVAVKHGPVPTTAVAYRAQLMKKPKSGEALSKLAEGYMQSGDLGAALLVLDRTEDADSQKSELYNLRGVALERSGDPESAYGAFQKAVSMDSSNKQARLNLAAHYAAYGYLDRARAEMQKAGTAPAPTGNVAEHPSLSLLGRLGGAK